MLSLFFHLSPPSSPTLSRNSLYVPKNRVEYLPDNWNISAYGIVCQQILPVVAWNSSCKQCINISTPFLLLAVILYNKLFFVIGHNLSHDIYIGSDWALYKKPFTGQACTSD